MLKIISSFLFLSHAFSWNMEHHLVITKIAETVVRSASPTAFQKILDKLSPLLEFFPERPTSFVESSVGLDLLSDENFGLLDYYHFEEEAQIHLEKTSPKIKFRNDFPQNMTYAITTAIQVIKDSLNPKFFWKTTTNGFMDSFYLRVLMNAAGETHQPLLTKSLYSDFLLEGRLVNGDSQGTRIPVDCELEERATNLAEFVDSLGAISNKKMILPLTEEGMQYIKERADGLMAEFPEEKFGDRSKILNPIIWLGESKELAKSILYHDVEFFPELRGDFVLMVRQMAKRQVALAGYRLANVLIDLFK